MDLIQIRIIRRAREIITPRDAWTQGEEARNIKGEPTLANEPDAVCYCMLGALSKASNEIEGCSWQGFALACAVLERQIHISQHDVSKCHTLQRFNDNPFCTHDAVLGIMDKALS